MVQLAHWPIDDGRGRHSPATIRDIVGGGSGAHDGLVSTWGSCNMNPGGIGGANLGRVDASGGWVDNIANPSDLQLLGEMTVMGWSSPDQYAGWSNTTMLASCSHDNDSEANNSPWNFEVTGHDLRFYWYTGSGSTLVMTQTTGSVVPVQGFSHLAAVRYQISAGFYGVRFYVNGVLVGTDNNSGPGYAGPTGGGNSIPYLCRRKDFVVTYQTNACFDSFRVYDSAELVAAILAIHNAEEPIVVGNLQSGIEDGRAEDTPSGSEYSPVDITDDSIVLSGGDANPGKLVETGPHNPRDNAGWSIR